MARDAIRARTSIGPEITDVAGEPAESTQLERLVARYHWAASYCEGATVLEVACGTGQGLGLFRSRAKRVFACDISAENLATARRGNGPLQPLVRADAQALPFADESMDVVVLMEAIYFLPSDTAFFREATRVLKRGGMCLVSAINKDCVDFNPHHSLYHKLYGVSDLATSFRQHGLEPGCFGIIPMDRPSLRSRAFKPLKSAAVAMNVIPESKRARLFLKRLVFGSLQTMPHDISTLPAPTVKPQPLPLDQPNPVYQVVLCAGRRS
ncbi:MAG TPA: class I SAM-dependent methyltransferase [Gemmatimonadaceae bacterium]|nr:class I SAM-dependent methyltransferase [Gemmatimonadaceae bacterium]